MDKVKLDQLTNIINYMLSVNTETN